MASPTDRIPIVEAYKENVALYKRFSDACRLLVENLMTANDIKVHTVTCREKEVASLQEKVLQPEKSYVDLTDITDLAGVRVTTYFEDDVDRVAGVIEKEFNVDRENSVDKAASLEPDQFGYASLHFVCRLSSKREKLAEYAAFGGLVCEIQIRSILQHAWAEIEHDLGYKSASAVPRHLRRRFSRVAALLEVADEDFKGLRSDLADYASTAEERIEEDPQNVLLDQATLQAYIDSDKDLLSLDERMAGILGAPLVARSEIGAVVLLPLVQDIHVDTVGQLRNVVNENSDLIVKQFEFRNAENPSDVGYWPNGGALGDLWAVVMAENEQEDGLAARARKHERSSGFEFESFAKEVMHAVRRIKSGDVPA